MPENPSAHLEQEIQQIEQSLETKREELQSQQERGEIESLPHDKETLKEVVHQQYVQSQSDQDDTAPSDSDGNTPSYMTPELQGEVQRFVDQAFESSISKAMASVRETKNPALVDAFHDALVDQLYDHLIEQGKLKKL